VCWDGGAATRAPQRACFTSCPPAPCPAAAHLQIKSCRGEGSRGRAERRDQVRAQQQGCTRPLLAPRRPATVRTHLVACIDHYPHPRRQHLGQHGVEAVAPAEAEPGGGGAVHTRYDSLPLGIAVVAVAAALAAALVAAATARPQRLPARRLGSQACSAHQSDIMSLQ
jgi:hypothetical protein